MSVTPESKNIAPVKFHKIDKRSAKFIGTHWVDKLQQQQQKSKQFQEVQNYFERPWKNYERL